MNFIIGSIVAIVIICVITNIIRTIFQVIICNWIACSIIGIAITAICLCI